MHFPSAPAEEVEALRALLSTPKRCAIVTHYNPDGDAMGSSLGLMHILKSAGHTAQVVLPNMPPSFLQWMPGFNECLAFDKHGAKAENAVKDCDLLFCVDFSRTDRVAKLEQTIKAAKTVVLIDHHQDPDHFAQVMFTDTEACATSQMIADIVRALGWWDHVNVDAATCLYTGLVTDSGSFRFSSTTPHTMRTAADLMEKGVRIATVHESIMDDNRAVRLKLLGFMLNERMEVLADHETVVIALSMADLKRFDFQPGDTEGFVNYGLSIRGIRSAFFRSLKRST
ncbi:MAG TPA: DHH family phosphoesterase, partial [Flavobacteriales bacterium]|nr:DHH family phosphoesterase [Flavobacteriales bacterium]